MKSAPRLLFLLGGLIAFIVLAGVTLTPHRRPAPIQRLRGADGRQPEAALNQALISPAIRVVDPVGGTPRPRPVSPPPVPPAPAADEFRPVPLVQFRQPLPDNEVWLVRTVLLNPEQGTLAEPGGWAAPARKWTAREHWK